MEAEKKSGKRRSLRRKLLAYFVLVSIVPFALAAYVAYETIRSEAENSAVRELRTVAEAAGQTLDVYMNDRLGDLTTWASLTMIKEALEVPEVRDDVQATFEELTEEYRAHDALLLLNNEGICLVSNWEQFIGIDFSQAAFFKGLGENKCVLVDMHKSKSLIEVKPDSKGWTVIMASPVLVDGKPAGLVASFLKWSAVERILSSVKVAETGKVFLMNKQNKFIGGPDQGRYLRSPKDPGIDLPELEQALTAGKDRLIFSALNPRSKKNERRIVGLAHLKGQGQFTGLGWRIGAEAPASEMLVFLPKMIRNLGIVAALIVFFVFILAFVLAGRIVKPIGSMERMSEKVSSGDLTEDLPDIDGNDEIGSLGKAFQAMIGNLRRQIRNINDEFRVGKASIGNFDCNYPDFHRG
jgi:methyl-accepting chemotaxis protein